MPEFLSPDKMTIRAAGESLGGPLAVQLGEAQETDRSFYDTFDGLLRDDGLLCVHEGGRLVLLERASGLERAGSPAAQPTRPLALTDLAPGPLRDALDPIVGVRALLPLVHVHCRTRSARVLDDEHKTVVRITIEEPVLVGAGNPYTALRPRVRLAPVRGYEDELELVRHHLEAVLGFTAADQPLVDEAVRAAGGIPGGVPSKIQVHLAYNQRADEAAALVLRRLLDVIEANLDGTIADIDSEFLHDLRVSVRRSRAVQRELKGVFPPEQLGRFRAEFRWLQQATGGARDLDVYVLEFDEYRSMLPAEMAGELDPLLDVLRRRRRAAHAELARVLRSGRVTMLCSEWRVFLDGLADLPQSDRPAATRPIGALAGERIAKVYRRMVKMGEAIEADSPAEEFHELRKKGKELRYLLELFAAPVYPGEVVKPMIKTLRSLQDVLGRHQDREVQTSTLRELRDQVAPLLGGPAALMAMGVLVDRLGQDERAARKEFAQTFAAFASKSQRRLVRETFA